MDVLIILALGFAILTVSGSVISKDNEKLAKQIRKEKKYVLSKIRNIGYEKKFMHDGMATAIMLDKENNIHLFDYTSHKKINYKDILQVEIIEDKETVTQTSRKSQIAGSALGGLALGGVGAIIGGLSGNKKTTEKFRDLGIRIIVNNATSPIHEFDFYNFKNPIKKDSEEFQLAYSQVYEWYKTIEVLISQADKEDEYAE